MKYIPRFTTEVIAVKLTQEVIADKGDYLVITDNRVEVMTEEEFFRVFQSAGNTKGNPPPKRKAAKRLAPGESSEDAIILAFGSDNAGEYLSGLTSRKISEIVNMNLGTVTGRVSLMIRDGFITADKTNRAWALSLTPKGIKHFMKIRGLIK
jgi:hypothetical protein